MTHTHTPWRLLLILLAALFLGACSSSDNDDDGAAADTATLSGTVAGGLALAGATVEVVDANGVIVTTTTDASGNYEVEVDPDAAPYLIKATSSDGTLVLYSWADADDLDGVVNVTDLTTIAVADAAGASSAGVPDPAALFDNWATENDSFDAEDIAAAEANVKDNFSDLFDAEDAADADIFNDSFVADGTGIDGVQDAIVLDFDCDGTVCTGSVQVDTDGDGIFEAFDFDFDGGGTGGGGVGGTAELTVSNANPSSGNGTITVTEVTVEDPEVTSDGLVLDGIVLVEVHGMVGGLEVEVGVHYSKSDGVVGIVSYEWGTSLPDAEIGGPFCGPNIPCSGTASVDPATGVITLTDVDLVSDDGDAATLSGTITPDASSGGGGGGGGGGIGFTPTGTWMVTVTDNTTGEVVATETNLPASLVFVTDAAIQAAVEALQVDLAVPGATVDVALTNAVSSFSSTGDGSVGSTITGSLQAHVSGTVTVSPLPPQPIDDDVDYTYVFERTL
jgi:hypothetical protein